MFKLTFYILLFISLTLKSQKLTYFELPESVPNNVNSFHSIGFSNKKIYLSGIFQRDVIFNLLVEDTFVKNISFLPYSYSPFNEFTLDYKSLIFNDTLIYTVRNLELGGGPILFRYKHTYWQQLSHLTPLLNFYYNSRLFFSDSKNLNILYQSTDSLQLMRIDKNDQKISDEKIILNNKFYGARKADFRNNLILLSHYANFNEVDTVIAILDSAYHLSYITYPEQVSNFTSDYSTYFAKNSTTVYLLHGNRLFMADFLQFNGWQEISIAPYLGPTESISAACLDQYDYFHFVSKDQTAPISVLRKLDDSRMPQILGFIPDSDNGQPLPIVGLAVDEHNNKWMTQGRWLMAFNENGVDVAENTHSDAVQIFPNPATNQIQLQSDFEIDNTSVFDLSGKKIFETGNNIKNIDIAFLNKGIYIIKIQANGKFYFSKLIKN